jgi:hypothetical protein
LVRWLADSTKWATSAYLLKELFKKANQSLMRTIPIKKFGWQK